MTVVVTTPTGNTGGKIAQQLLSAGEKVAVLVRNPDKLTPMIRQNAIVYQGSVDDPEAFVQAKKCCRTLSRCPIQL